MGHPGTVLMLKSNIRPLLRLIEKGFEDTAGDRSPGGAEIEVKSEAKTILDSDDFELKCFDPS